MQYLQFIGWVEGQQKGALNRWVLGLGYREVVQRLSEAIADLLVVVPPC